VSRTFAGVRQRAAILLAALLAPAAAAAEQIEEVQVTARRRAEAELDVPNATTVVGREALRALAPQTAMDTLHGEPGTFVQQTTPGQGVVIVRGLKGSEVLHLVDGFRLNNAIFRNAPNQYIALVDSQSLERVEVVRGPMSALYGGDAMGGVVQMLTWDPRFDGDALATAGRLRSSYGSADRSLLSRAETAIGNDAFSLSGGLTMQDVEPLRTGSGDRVPFSDFSARGGDVKFVARLGEQHELLVSAQRMEQPNTPRVDQLNAGFGQSEPERLAAQFRPQTRSFHHGRWRWDAGAAAFDELELHFGRQRIEDGNRSRAFAGDAGDVRETRERTVVSTTGWTLGAVKALGSAHTLGYGADYYRDRVYSTTQQRTFEAGSALEPELARVFPPRFPDGALMEQMGVYVADHWLLTPRLALDYGLRYSVVESDIPGGFDRVRNADASGNLGLHYRVSDALALVANVGRGFRAPNVFDLGTIGERPGSRFNRPNPDLEPERIATVDAGFKYAGERLRADVSAFFSRYSDKITSVRTGILRPEDGRELTQSVNASRVRYVGLEAGLRYQWDEALSFYGTGTWTHGRERIGGSLGVDRSHSAERVPPLFGKLGVEWRALDTLLLEGYAYYADDQERLSPGDLGDPRINPDGTPGWSTLNARVGFALSETASVSLRLENLLDRRYREHASGIDEPGFNAIVTLDLGW
jgi:hemoglobin/transferrin/lactoferrin receptor protein